MGGVALKSNAPREHHQVCAEGDANSLYRADDNARKSI